jgi:hypothetical protein
MTEAYLKIPPDLLTTEEAKPPTFGAISQRAGFDSGAMMGYAGEEWIERVIAWSGWSLPPSWGRDGYNLGDWPLVVIAHHVYRTDDGGKRYDLAQRIEGDVTVWTFEDPAAMFSATDRLAEYWWRQAPDTFGPRLQEALAATPRGEFLPAEFRGPFSRARLSTETEEVKT